MLFAAPTELLYFLRQTHQVPNALTVCLYAVCQFEARQAEQTNNPHTQQIPIDHKME